MLLIHAMPGYLIRRAHQISSAIFVDLVGRAGHDITPVQYGALSGVRAHPGLDQATLAELIAYDRVTIGGVIDRLEAKGLIKRRVSKTDRRARSLVLTEAGKALLEQLDPIIREVQVVLLKALQADEQIELVRLLQRVGEDTAAHGMAKAS